MSSFMMLLAERVLPTTSINRTVGIIVWVGVIVFTLAFFVLSWTRLGNAKPLVKCLTLSVFAHVLLGIFFYGTQMLGLEMDLGGDDPITISLISESSDGQLSPAQADHEMVMPDLAEEYPQKTLVNEFQEGLEEVIASVEDATPQNESVVQPADVNGREDNEMDEKVTAGVAELEVPLPARRQRITSR